MPNPLRFSAEGIDLAGRVVRSASVAASPALAAETVVCTLTVNRDLPVGLGVILYGFVALTVGASGASVTTKLRQTGTSGTTVKTTGACTVTAADLRTFSIIGLDTSPVLPGQVYVITLTVGSGAAESTVSAAELIAVVV